MPSIFKIFGEAQFRGDATGSGNALNIADSSGTARLTVANTGRLTLGQDTTFTSSIGSVVTTSVANGAIYLRPNGSGAIAANVPDGTATGGNARGGNSVDWQTTRGAATNVASNYATTISGGASNSCSGGRGVVSGGESNNNAGQYGCITGGGSNSVGSDYGVITGGSNNTITAGNTYGSILGGQGSICAAQWGASIGGKYAFVYVKGQRATGGGQFAVHQGECQTTTTILTAIITGTGIAELRAHGDRFILAIGGNTAQTARALTFFVQITAIVQTQGIGTALAGDVYSGSYSGTIKRFNNSTTLIGSVVPIAVNSDTSMSSSVVTISADDTNESLNIQFTPPTTAAGDTVIRVTAAVIATEVGRT